LHPIGVVFDRVDVDRFVESSMVFDVCLSIPVEVKLAEPNAVVDRTFKKPSGPFRIR
jgi:hypothetical protein